MRDPVTDLNMQGWFIFGSVLLFAALHGLLYVVAIPPWDLYDEEQHLSYALYLADDQMIPEIDDPVQPRILANAVATDRWSVYRIGRPISPERNEFGLEGFSYEAYHPPLYYAAIAPLTYLSASDAWRELYAARILGVFLIFGFAGVCWGYARDWLPDASPIVWGCVVVIATATPAVGAAAGRVNNDLLVGLLLASGTLLAARLLETRQVDVALYLGLVSGAAILTKGQGAVVLLVIAASIGLLTIRKQLTAKIATLIVIPPVACLLVWVFWTFTRYEQIVASSAFLDFVGPSQSLGVGDFALELWLNGWSSYWGSYAAQAGNLRPVTGILAGVAIVAGLAGVTTGRDAWLHGERGRERLVLIGALFVGLIAVMWIANSSGLARPHGRMMLGAYPAIATIVIGGIHRLLGEIAAIQVSAVSVGASAVFFLFWFMPFFY